MVMKIFIIEALRTEIAANVSFTVKKNYVERDLSNSNSSCLGNEAEPTIERGIKQGLRCKPAFPCKNCTYQAIKSSVES